MNRVKRIEEKLTYSNCEVNYLRLCDKYDGMYLPDVDEKPQIIVAPDVTNEQSLSVLAHEAGHHFRGLSGHVGRDEERANRWAAKELISVRDIIQATINGCQSYYELAETLGLDEEFVKTSIQCFKRIYGTDIEIDGYYLNLHPVWVKEIKTGQIWPED